MPGLEGKVALITGGGSGLGAALCHSLSEAGVKIAFAEIDEARAMDTAQALEAKGCKSLPLVLDISDATQARQAVEASGRHFGRLDILVNNAGIDVTQPIEELSVADWERVLAVNLTAPFLLAKFAVPVMRGQGHGHIVNIASTAAKRAWPNAAVYHASKYGVLGLSHALHAELRPHGIKVTAVISGGMRTPFLLDRFPDIDPQVLQDPRHVADTVRYVLTQPDETVIPEIMVLPMRETSWP